MDIKIEDLNSSLSGKRILRDISLQVARKEFLGIIGPNGSGKSTLLKNIYRVLSPSSGRIYLDGKRLEDLALKETGKILSVVGQHSPETFDFRVLDMVLMGRAPHKKFLERDNREDYEIALGALKKVGMEDFTNRNYNSLSGGERQRVILARALAQKPRCLILDEPTNHLDIKYQFEIMNIARELGITVVAAIHDLNIASYYCNRIYVLNRGRIIGGGPPEEVLTEELIYNLYGIEAKFYYDEEYGTRTIIYNPNKI